MINVKYTSNGLLEFNNDSRFRGINGNGQSIVVIDTGFNLSHTGLGPDNNKDGISDRIVRKDLDFTRQKDGTVQDGSYHGTAVTGIATSIAPGAKIIPIQVNLVSDIGKALKWVIANEDKYNITSVNISLSTMDNDSRDFKYDPKNTHQVGYKEFEEIHKAGIPVTVAAGNFYQQYQQKPGMQLLAAYWNTIGAMATDSDGLTKKDTLAPFSQRRSDALGAPGKGIEVLYRNNTTAKGQGTSFASPFIAGSLSLLQGVSERYLGRELSPGELMNITQSTADPVKDGYKQINVFKAANAIYNLGKLSTAGTMDNVDILDIFSNASSSDSKACLIPSDTFS